MKIKSGGHATNAGFLSTSGIKIAMYSFSNIVYNSTAQTATLGMGAIWDDVYIALEPYNMTVVGPKITGIGIRGIVLGGGTILPRPTTEMKLIFIVAYELVIPNGTVAEITDSTNPDLFFALRGIVTTVTIKTYPQSLFWGGLITYGKDKWDAASAAVANYAVNVTNCPDGIFDEFLSIDAIYTNISTRTYIDLIQSFPLNATSGLRTVFSLMAMEDVTVPVLDMIVNETLTRGPELAANASAGIVMYSMDIFLPMLYNHVDSPTAYPPLHSQGYSYIKIFCGWLDASADDTIFDTVNASSKYMTEVLTSYGQHIADVAVYPNHAPPGTSLET
ncbi:hypothetical protein BDR03DRAFT_1008787, partial [Suillus americanus]